MEGKGGRRQRRAGRAAGAAARRGQAVLLLGQSGTGRGGFIRLCQATDQGAALPRQDRWRGKPSHVIDQQFGRRHVSPLPHQHACRGTGFWPRHGNRLGQKC